MEAVSGRIEIATGAEARTGLEPWVHGELPPAPNPRGLGWLSVVGPGVIVLGLSIGSGEFLLGPAVFVKYGLSLLWVTVIAVYFQTIFNTELMRYTVATGEPAFTGFMRTGPSAKFWAWWYVVFYFLQAGWPGWAATAAGAIYFLFVGKLAGPEQASLVYWIGVGSFALCVCVLLVGRRIERTLELLNWVMVTCILGSFLILALIFVPAPAWAGAVAGLGGYDLINGRFDFFPAGVDFFLLAALVAYSGCGGMNNVTLSNWARDKGYGMGSCAGYIPAAVGGKKVNLAHTGFFFTPTEESMKRWKGWWRIVRADQWGVFFIGALLGMILPALLYVTFIPAGSDVRGLGIAAALAQGVGVKAGALLAGSISVLGAWLLLKTQLDTIEGMTRAITDILWTGSTRVRAWRGGDVRAIYYGVMGVIVVWGVIALRLAQPIVLIQIGANVAAFIFVFASLHLLYVNTTLLPVALRPPLWRRMSLVAMCLFYAFFLFMSMSALR